MLSLQNQSGIEMKRLSFLLILCFLALSAAAQNATATFGGRITDENGPIEGVTVVAIHQGTNAQYYATTNRGGWWQLLDILPGGPYTLRIHYFGYAPLTIRNLYAYAGQNTVIDADLEAGTTYVHSDEAATSMRVGADLGGGRVPVSPLGYDLVSQRIYTPVAFDVRQEAELSGMAQQWTTPTGSSRFHASAYDFYTFGEAVTGLRNTAGLTVATPLGNQDYQLFAGAQYDRYGLSAAGRFDARLGEANRLSLSGGRVAGALGADAWGGGDFISQLNGGTASNRAQVLWSGDASLRQLRVGDDFTLAAGPQRILAGVQLAYQQHLALDSTAFRGDFYVQDVVRLGRRLTVQGGLRFSIPFTFSPRLSFYYDILGNGRLVMRLGTAVYGRRGEGTIWKNLAAFDTRLPGQFLLTLEGVYGQTWRKAFHISSLNVMAHRYELTARLERPLTERMWALASYTRANGFVRDRVQAGFHYRMPWSQWTATTLTLRYDGHSIDASYLSSAYPAPENWMWFHQIEARLAQDIIFPAGGRDHTLQITAYYRYNIDRTGYLMAGLRYIL